MRYIKYIGLFLSFIISMKLASQTKQMTLEELIPGGKNYSKYKVEMPRKLAWLGDALTYVKGDTIYEVNPHKKAFITSIYTVNDFNTNLKLDDAEALKSLYYIYPITSGDNLFSIYTNSKLYIYNDRDKSIISTFSHVSGMNNQDLSPDNKKLAYTKENNLYMQTSDGVETEVASDPDKGIVYGQTVHRNEFGIHKGIFWSPKGNLLAFYRKDETMVTDYPLVDVSARVAKLKDIKYPMAGMKSHHVTVGIYNPDTKQTVYLKTGTPKDKYLTNISWSPDEKSIYLAELNRGQDTCRLKRYDALTGNLEAELFMETRPQYVEPQNPVKFLKNDAGKFIWQSDRDGYNHIYLYDTSGKLLKQLTKGAWVVTQVLGFDEKGENIIYISTEDSPIEKHIYMVNIKTGKRTKLSKEEGVHTAQISKSGKYIYDWYSSQHNPGKVSFIDIKSGKSYVFYSAPDPYKNVTLPEITISSLKANDGKTDLYYRLTKPTNFDPSKKYPVIVYVYGGPHSQLVDNSWLGQARGWDIYMAQKGYIVFTLDNRGTSDRGINFENITFRQLGVIETEDQMTGIDYLKSLPYVDADRIGVHGWSFGGFMTLNLMLRHPETFKTGVAGGPVTDWKYYEIMYGERYMDTPQDNPKGYKNSSMVNRAGDLKGRLLIIHGDQDPTVVMQQSLQFLKSAIKEGTHPDFFVYPGHGHNMYGHDRVHLHEHITRYFDDFLK